MRVSRAGPSTQTEESKLFENLLQGSFFFFPIHMNLWSESDQCMYTVEDLMGVMGRKNNA